MNTWLKLFEAKELSVQPIVFSLDDAFSPIGNNVIKSSSSPWRWNGRIGTNVFKWSSSPERRMNLAPVFAREMDRAAMNIVYFDASGENATAALQLTAVACWYWLAGGHGAAAAAASGGLSNAGRINGRARAHAEAKAHLVHAIHAMQPGDDQGAALALKSIQALSEDDPVLRAVKLVGEIYQEQAKK